MSQKITKLLIFAALFILSGTILIPPALAAPAKAKEQLPVIMVGDRLVDVAYHLGVIPAAMSVRCSLWPMCNELNALVQVIGCPGCLLKKKSAPLFKYGEKHGIKRVFIEKTQNFCVYKSGLDTTKIGTLAAAKGYEVTYVDFSQGLAQAVTRVAELIGRTDKAATAMAGYTTAMNKTREFINGNTFVKKVVIIRGTYQAANGKTFLRIEVPGGYSDIFILNPLGIQNVGHLAAPKGKAPSKGHIQVRKLNGLIAANPDAIIMTGDALAVQKALYIAAKKDPALANVSALRSHAVFSLPGYVDASVMSYPEILKLWADVLKR